MKKHSVVVKVFVCVLLVAGGCLTTRSAMAQTYWIGSSDGPWATGANWAGGSAPTGTAGIAIFTNQLTALRTVTMPTEPWAINALRFTNTVTANGWLVIGGALNLGGTTPTFVVQGSSLTAAVASVLSGSDFTKTGSGTLTLTGASSVGLTNMTGGGTLVLSGGGTLTNASAGTSINIGASSSPSSVLVTDPNSFWNANGNNLYFANAAYANANNLTIANYGVVSNVAVFVFCGTNSVMTISSGGKLYSTGAARIGAGGGVGGHNNSARITGADSLWNLGGGSLWIGQGTTPKFTIDNSGVVTNAGLITVASASTSLVLTNGGTLYSTGLTVSAVNNFTGLVAGASSFWNAGGGKILFTVTGGVGGAMNLVTVTDSGILTNVYFQFSYNGSPTAGSYNSVVVTNGGKVYAGAGATIMGNNSGGISNGILVSGTGSLWDSGGQNLSVAGLPVQTNDFLTVSAGGVMRGIGTLYVGNAGSNAVNTVQVTGGGLLEVTNLTVGKNADATSASNSVTVSGGVLQFTTAKPAITNNNTGGSGNSITLDNATLSFLGLQSGAMPNLTNNLAASGSISTNNITYTGNNTYRLDNCLASNSVAAGYTFATGVAYNFAGLELINGTTAIRNKGVTIGATGSLLVSNTTATIEGAFTNNSANVNLAAVTGLIASNGIVWLGGSAATTTAGTATFDPYTTNRLDSGMVTWNQSAATATQEVKGVVMGSGDLVKSGPGVLVLAASNLYTGATTVSNGTLLVNGSVNSAVTVVSGASLGGTGTLYGAVTLNGGAIKATIYDNDTSSLLSVNGALDISGATLNLAGTNNLPGSTQIYTIIHATSVSGTFVNGNTVLPKGWRLSYEGGYVRVRPGYSGSLFMIQ